MPKFFTRTAVLLLILLSLALCMGGCLPLTEIPAATSIPSASASVAPVASATPASASPEASASPDASAISASRFLLEMIDVGQGDCLLAQSPGGEDILIDAGTQDSADEIRQALKQQNVDDIDLLVSTHPHADHCGSMQYVLEHYPVHQVMLTDAVSTTNTYLGVLNAIDRKKVPAVRPKAGEVMNLGDVRLEILGPIQEYDDLNNMSIVIRMVYKNNTFMLTGDAEKQSENDILAKFDDLKADVLKVGHHGSNTSTSKKFLTAVSPVYAAISVGAGNDYHHPHPSTLKLLSQYKVKTYRTDESGDILFYSDGKTITVQTEK